MKQSTQKPQIGDYLKKNWFQICLVILAVVACYKSNWTVHFQLVDPPKQQLQMEGTKSENTSTNKQTPEAENVSNLSISSLFGLTKKNRIEAPNLDEDTKIIYMKRFAQVAVAERKKYGVPSSIIIANAVLQSYAGKRDMTTNSNNHFAIPCSFDWQGQKDTYNGECYRRYENAWVSFRDHSLFITTGAFAKLKTLKSTDFKAWAKGLQTLGYPSTNDHLADELIAIIEKYTLYQLDKM